MAENERIICAGNELAEGGLGVRFTVTTRDGETQAFAVRSDGVVYAYLNRCAHVPVELDWQAGDFFDYSKLYLICATHGATYLPRTGVCVRGPCPGKRLIPVPVEERDGQVYLTVLKGQ